VAVSVTLAPTAGVVVDAVNVVVVAAALTVTETALEVLVA
jgi:hypothetical protein